MKRIALLAGGISGFVCALGFGLFLVQYLAGGVGLQFLERPRWVFEDPVSSGSILLGLFHVVGLATASFLCFAVGAGFCACGLVIDDKTGAANVPGADGAVQISDVPVRNSEVVCLPHQPDVSN